MAGVGKQRENVLKLISNENKLVKFADTFELFIVTYFLQSEDPQRLKFEIRHFGWISVANQTNLDFGMVDVAASVLETALQAKMKLRG